MENEIMNYEETGMDTVVDVVETENSGISTGAAMAAGAGLTLLIAGAVKLVKWGVGKIRAKREARLWGEDEVVVVTEEDVEDVAE